MKTFIIRAILLVIIIAGMIFAAVNLNRAQHATDSGPMPTTPFEISADKAQNAPHRSDDQMLVPANHVSVPSLGILMPYHDSGVNEGELLIDKDPGTAVRWNGSKSSAGSQVFAAHVNYSNGSLGPMAAITKAQPGTQIYVSDAKGKVTEYVAISLYGVLKSDLDPTLFETKGERTLALITCGGKQYQDENGHWKYESNVVLRAALTKNP